MAPSKVIALHRPGLGAQVPGLSEPEYDRVRDFMYRKAGVSLGQNKQALVASRLAERVRTLGLPSYASYIERASHDEPAGEMQTAIDLLTTNETYFYREPAHFQRLAEVAKAAASRRESLNIWSAASSSGEEIYTMAMVLQSLVDSGTPLNWAIMGSDISSRVLMAAAKGVYPIERTQRLPEALLRRYCLKGHGPADGTILVRKALRQKVHFEAINLVEPLPDIGPFDVIFMRNVLIYFDMETKAQVVRSVMSKLKPHGLLFVGLAESLNGVVDGIRASTPGVYAARRP